ncbi:MAG TPA: pyridoxamine 5'-phosphate oxidase family protein [Methylophilus sp.]|uniref:pyridoxamine 5'-phosphate oxidase family protein n=1 Tax=Methylophilus sp. TaxID=29541 RepID=UPI002C8F68C4|nr:pyridoxamine 5'-phosphate oxidase family protein [Methylophilus sp.]HSH87618.1 pyridoxamine 5'-phosphate oxidase family protein [Methylophilus sp.]
MTESFASTLINPSDVVFTSAVKARQEEMGSRAGYAKFESTRGWESRVTPVLADFIAAQTSMYIATANAEGQPYMQHRGGPPGFLHVLDEQTLAFADYAGNKQYITAGNLDENPKAQLFLMDYANTQRVKIWGEAKIVTGDEALIARVSSPDYPARVERVIVFTIKAWDANCPKHIPKLLKVEDVIPAIQVRDQKIAALEARLKELEKNIS